MVKGLTRRVVVVKPDTKLFEEAIFIVRDEYHDAKGASQEDVVKAARKTAREFAQSRFGILSKKTSTANRLLWMMCGIGIASIIWSAITILINS